MKKTGEKMTLRGFKWDKKKKALSTSCGPIKHQQPYSDIAKGKHHGMPITKDAAVQMVQLFYDRVVSGQQGSPFDNILMVDFSKASVFRILSQENCEFIRFYFCIPDANKNDASLLLEGLNSQKKSVKGKGIAGQIKTNKSNNKTILVNNLTDDDPAQYEEKGNGTGLGGGSVKNILFMKEEIKSYLSTNNKNPNYSDFVTSLY